MKLYKFNIHTNDGIATVVAQTKLDAYEIALGIWKKYSLRVLSFFTLHTLVASSKHPCSVRGISPYRRTRKVQSLVKLITDNHPLSQTYFRCNKHTKQKYV